jgi:hypothetical protein
MPSKTTSFSGQKVGKGGLGGFTQVYQLKDPGALTAAVNQDRAVMSRPGTIVDVRASVGVAPTGATAIWDVNKNGTTIFTTQTARPTIPISGFSSPVAVPAVKTVAAGDVLVLDCDQIGSTVAGTDGVVAVTVQHT